MRVGHPVPGWQVGGEGADGACLDHQQEQQECVNDGKSAEEPVQWKMRDFRVCCFIKVTWFFLQWEDLLIISYFLGNTWRISWSRFFTRMKLLDPRTILMCTCSTRQERKQRGGNFVATREQRGDHQSSSFGKLPFFSKFLAHL